MPLVFLVAATLTGANWYLAVVSIQRGRFTEYKCLSSIPQYAASPGVDGTQAEVHLGHLLVPHALPLCSKGGKPWSEMTMSRRNETVF